MLLQMFGEFEGLLDDSNGPSPTGNWNNDLWTPPEWWWKVRVEVSQNDRKVEVKGLW